MVFNINRRKEKLLDEILENYRNCLSILEGNKQLRNEYYHRIVNCKELINLFEFSTLPKLLEMNNLSNENYEELKTMARDIKAVNSYVKSAF